MVTLSRNHNLIEISLIPNRSATWRQTKWLVAFLGFVCLSIALAWTFLGAYLVLPFAGLEVGLLWLLAHHVCSHTYSKQKLLIDEDSIEVQWGRNRLERRWRFVREACLFRINKARHSLSPDSIFLDDGYQRIAIGERLNKADNQELIALLQRLDLPCRLGGQHKIRSLDVFD
ncbi:DUF2244 domain-containing protein [Aliiglaciecola sp. CAU 1673]|uniref:DUF2244 domain-containing protein n=1 Tax=Aliiglaciecola sp. CAU 1673 TaxID=3032595 RepID=UPI0023DA6287|nr:DUF2244 domain-containing protein [Aliiglaciecola sp. CAU 1673]MDF2180307.1 DUF2244 domain-containing protein [Aliiglaciecola sp. CAU 1673]